MELVILVKQKCGIYIYIYIKTQPGPVFRKLEVTNLYLQAFRLGN